MDENKACWSEDEWRKNNWRCGHGWLRNEQCEICNAPKREWQGLTPEEYSTLRLSVPPIINDFVFADVVAIIESKLKERNT